MGRSGTVPVGALKTSLYSSKRRVGFGVPLGGVLAANLRKIGAEIDNRYPLQGSEYSGPHDLLRLFAHGTWADYKANAAVLPPLQPPQILKLKQLTVMSLAEAAKVLPYDLLMDQLDVSNVRELEDLLINECMYTGIVQGKLDQRQRCFEVHFAAGRDLRPGQLDSMIQALSGWLQTSETLLLMIQEKIKWADNMSEVYKRHKTEVEAKAEEVRINIRVLLTDYLRCLPAEVRTKLVDEAYVEQHTFASFSKKALDIEAKLGSAHKASHDGRKRLPQDWKKKGQLMFVDHDGQTTEIDDFPDLGELTKQDGDSETSDGGVVAPIKEKARGTGKKKDLPRQEGHDGGGLIFKSWECFCEQLTGKHLGLVGVLAALTRAEVLRLPSPLQALAKASDPHIAPQTHSDPPTLCSQDVSEALEELGTEWSGKDPRDSWAMISRGPKGEYFVVEVGVGGRKVGAFADIGSTQNFISRACVDRLRLGDQVQRLSRTVAPMLANKHQMVVKDYVKDVACTFSYGGGEVIHKISFLVSDELPFDMLLGMYYLEVSQPQFDWDRKVLIHKFPNGRTVILQKYGLYEFVVMPFGLCNAPGTFQHAMNRIFHEYLDKFIVVYLDDILIFSRTVEDHAEHLKTVLGLLRQHQYKVNLDKCEFGRTKILYLGHEISADGLRPEDAKVASIRDWPRPQTVTEVRSFLGMTGYYHPFVKNYSTIASLLTDLTRLDTPWEWTEECEASFKKLKYALTHYEVLKLPNPDKPFVMTTDASQYGIGAVLAEQEGPKLRPIEYMSKKMPSQKLAKSTYEKELYALYRTLVHWRHYLLGRFFYVRSDHETLRWIKTQPVLSDALKRWIQVIDVYDYQLDPIKGTYNKVADALSRRADYLGALVTEFGISEELTRSLVEAYQGDPVMSEIIRRFQAKDKKTLDEFTMVDGLLFLEKAGNKRCFPPMEVVDDTKLRRATVRRREVGGVSTLHDRFVLISGGASQAEGSSMVLPCCFNLGFKSKRKSSKLTYRSPWRKDFPAVFFYDAKRLLFKPMRTSEELLSRGECGWAARDSNMVDDCITKVCKGRVGGTERTPGTHARRGKRKDTVQYCSAGQHLCIRGWVMHVESEVNVYCFPSVTWKLPTQSFHETRSPTVQPFVLVASRLSPRPLEV
ncbi:hypothetical protein CBR_g6296 [Chara braunii]|uniref:PCI domain-containing protein n=1 Tax=Chara braunii TaxID=69332 RepID=A0A388KJC7_CHABU|nr:hypothetical protein CBR_g6296 [Chara braunii]|eukprot:GBG70165.1 hypothetical protein CBR_g6296 [Chara braunii]